MLHSHLFIDSAVCISAKDQLDLSSSSMFTVVLLHLTAYFVACDCTHCRLLDILAGRKDRRRVTGEIRLNGEISPKDMQHQLGYVVQVRYCCVCMVHPSTERHPQGKPN